MLACKLQVCVAPFPTHPSHSHYCLVYRQAGSLPVSPSSTSTASPRSLYLVPASLPLSTPHSSPVHRRTPCLFVGINISFVVVVVVACLFVCLFNTLQHFCSGFLYVCVCLFFQFPFFGFPFHIGHSATCFALQLQLLVAPRVLHAPIPHPLSNGTTGVACILAISIIHVPLLETSWRIIQIHCPRTNKMHCTCRSLRNA